MHEYQKALLGSSLESENLHSTVHSLNIGAGIFLTDETQKSMLRGTTLSASLSLFHSPNVLIIKQK